MFQRQDGNLVKCIAHVLGKKGGSPEPPKSIS